MLLLVSELLVSASGSSSGQPPPPSPTSVTLPGTTVLESLAHGLDGWALIAAGLGIVIGAIMWAFGNYSQNWQQAYNGRRGVLVSALAALLIGGAPYIITSFHDLGSHL